MENSEIRRENIPCFPIEDYNLTETNPPIQTENKYSIEETENMDWDQILMNKFEESDYVMLENLGERSFGIVKKAYHKKLGKSLALKSFKKQNDPKISKLILSEISLLLKIEEINKENEIFLKYYGNFKDCNGNLILQMESGEATLQDIITSGKVFKVEGILHILCKLVESFAILQENGISNRDIKPQNIILVEEQRNDDIHYIYKAADFGIGLEMSSGVEEASFETLIGCTEDFAAPEIISHPLFGFYNPYVADVYSLGIVVLKMIYPSFEKIYLAKGILQNEHFLKEYKPLAIILEKMLIENPKNRVDFISLNLFLKEVQKSQENLLIKPFYEGKYKEEKLLELKSFDINEEELDSLICLGDFYGNNHNFKKSEIFFEKSLILSEKLFGKPPETGCLSEKHKYLGIICHWLGYVSANLGDFDKAEKLMKIGINIKESLKFCSLDLAWAYVQLGDLYIIEDLSKETTKNLIKLKNILNKAYNIVFQIFAVSSQDELFFLLW